MVPYTLPQGNFNFPRSTNKIQFFNEILIPEKNYIDLMKCLRYKHQAIFHCGGGSNLILGIGRENKLFFSENFSHCQVFPQIVRKMILWCKKKIITHTNGFV